MAVEYTQRKHHGTRTLKKRSVYIQSRQTNENDYRTRVTARAYAARDRTRPTFDIWRKPDCFMAALCSACMSIALNATVVRIMPYKSIRQRHSHRINVRIYPGIRLDVYGESAQACGLWERTHGDAGDKIDVVTRWVVGNRVVYGIPTDIYAYIYRNCNASMRLRLDNGWWWP